VRFDKARAVMDNECDRGIEHHGRQKLMFDQSSGPGSFENDPL